MVSGTGLLSSVLLPKMFWAVFIVSAMGAGTETNLSPSLNALLELMTLTENTCGAIDWCTVKTESAVETYMRGCCVRCYCDQDCTRSDSCCPDFRLSQLLNGRVFMNITDFAFAINEEIIASHSEDDTTDDVMIDTDGEKTTECIHARLFDVSPTRPKSSAYLMVSKCPDNTTVGDEVKTKCESPKVDPEIAQIHDFIPLQSVTTGEVYRNRYCMLCNTAENDTLIEWDVYIATLSKPLDILKEHFSSMGAVFTFIFQQDPQWASVDIFFAPDEKLKNLHPPKKCHNFALQSCKPKNMTIKAELTACGQYVLPVYVNVNRKFTTFKNLACLSCNGTHIDTPHVCRKYDAWEASDPFLCRIQNEYLPRGLRHGEEPDMESTFSSRCDPGFAFDTRVEACRKIYCPCGMVIHEGKCVFILQDIYKKFFDVHVDIEPVTMPVRGQTMAKLLLALFQHLNHAFESNGNFTADHIVLMVSKRKQSAPISFFAYLVFSGLYTHSRLPDASNFVAKNFRGLKVLEMEETTITVNMMVTDSVVVSSFSTQDINTGYEYEVALSTPGDVFADKRLGERSVIPLSECNLCYRIELLAEEMQFKGRAVYIKPTQQVDVGFSMIESNGTGVLVCASKVTLDIDTEKVMVDGNVFVDSETSDQSAYEEFVVNMVVLFTVGSVVLVVCIIVAIKVCVRRSTISNN